MFFEKPCISIHVPRVEDDACDIKDIPSAAKISIHVPRVEDDVKMKKNTSKKRISIHVPRVEDDL